MQLLLQNQTQDITAASSCDACAADVFICDEGSKVDLGFHDRMTLPWRPEVALSPNEVALESEQYQRLPSARAPTRKRVCEVLLPVMLDCRLFNERPRNRGRWAYMHNFCSHSIYGGQRESFAAF